MPTQETLLAFAIVTVGIQLVPGPSNLFLLGHGIGHGRRSALAAAAGQEAASALRVFLMAVGLSALLAASAFAFNTIRWAGVAYLVYLGVQAFRAGPTTETPTEAARQVSLSRSVSKGLLVGLGNPKMVIFFVAFFPQFIDPARGSEAGQILVLGSVFWMIGAVWDLVLACASGSLGSWMRDRPRIRAAQPRFEGVTYFGLAGWSALTGSRTAH